MNVIASQNFVVSTEVQAGQGWPFDMPAFRSVDEIPGHLLHRRERVGQVDAAGGDRGGGGVQPGGRLGSQFIIATHSPIVMAYPEPAILLLDERGMRAVTYEETEHYSVMRDFLNHREAMLRELMR